MPRESSRDAAVASGGTSRTASDIVSSRTVPDASTWIRYQDQRVSMALPKLWKTESSRKVSGGSAG